MYDTQKLRFVREMEFDHYHESRHYKIVVNREITTHEILLAIFPDTRDTLIGYQYLEAGISIFDMMTRLRQNLHHWVVNTESYKLVRDKSYKIVTPKMVSEYEIAMQEGLNTTKKVRKKINAKTGKVKATVKPEPKKPTKRKTKPKSEPKPKPAPKKTPAKKTPVKKAPAKTPAKKTTRKTTKKQTTAATALF